MSDTTFKKIFERKQSTFEEKVEVDGLLSKLEDYGIITTNQRNAIEVTCATVCNFY